MHSYPQMIIHLKRVAQCVILALLLSRPVKVVDASALRIGVHLPFKEGLSTVASIVDMIRVLNDNTTIVREMVPNHNVELYYTATSHSRTIALAATLPAVINNQLHATIGDWSSRITVPTAVALGLTYKLWTCSGSSTSAELTSKTEFPYYFRTIADDPQSGVAMAAFVRNMGWSSVAVLACSDSYGSSLSSAFFSAANRFNINIPIKQFFPSAATDVSVQLSIIKNSGLRVIVLHGQTSDALIILPAAAQMGLIGPEYVWVSGEGIIDLLVREMPPTLRPVIESAANGMVVVYPSETTTALTGQFTSVWKQQYPTVEIPPYGLMYCDCLLSLARGLARISNQFGYNQLNSRDYNATLDDFLDRFDGVSGNLDYDQFGNRLGTYLVYNAWNGTMIPVAQLNADLSQSELRPFKFASGSSKVPPERPLPVPPFAHWASPLGISAAAIISICGMATILTCTYITINRHTESVKHLSYFFLMLISSGCFMVLVSAMLRIGNPASASCTAINWFDVIGVSLVLASSAAKAFRIYSIYDNAQLGKVKRITNRDLFIGVSVIVSIQSLIILIGGFLAPTVSVIVDASTPYYACRAVNQSILGAAASGLRLGFVGLLTLIVLYLAFRTRHVSKAFGESVYLFLTMQSITLTIVCLIPFYTLEFGEQHVVANAIQLALLLYGSMSTYYTLVGRVAVLVFMQHKDQAASSFTLDMAADGKCDSQLVSSTQSQSQSHSAGCGKPLGVRNTATYHSQPSSSPSSDDSAGELRVCGPSGRQSSIAPSVAVTGRESHMTGVFAVKRGDKVFSTWRKHRICVCFRQGLVTLIQTSSAADKPQLSTTSQQQPAASATLSRSTPTTLILHPDICTNDVPDYPHCLRLSRGGSSSENWLVQMSDKAEHEAWVKRLTETSIGSKKAADGNKAIKEVDELLKESSNLLIASAGGLVRGESTRSRRTSAGGK